MSLFSQLGASDDEEDDTYELEGETEEIVSPRCPFLYVYSTDVHTHNTHKIIELMLISHAMYNDDGTKCPTQHEIP